MALHKIGEARQVLHDTLTTVLGDGRVSAYPSSQDVGVRAWIDVPSVSVNGRTIEVEFPVYCTYDGADRAQVAGLDDVVSRVWDACETISNLTPVRINPGPNLVVNNKTRRVQIVTVRRGIAGRTLCPPDDPGSSPIPPDLVQE